MEITPKILFEMAYGMRHLSGCSMPECVDHARVIIKELQKPDHDTDLESVMEAIKLFTNSISQTNDVRIAVFHLQDLIVNSIPFNPS